MWFLIFSQFTIPSDLGNHTKHTINVLSLMAGNINFMHHKLLKDTGWIRARKKKCTGHLIYTSLPLHSLTTPPPQKKTQSQPINQSTRNSPPSPPKKQKNIFSMLEKLIVLLKIEKLALYMNKIRLLTYLSMLPA